MHFSGHRHRASASRARSRRRSSEPFTQARWFDDAPVSAAPGWASTICQQLVALMGGRIWVESEPQRRQRVPFRRDAADQLAVGDPTSSFRSRTSSVNMAALVVDDNATNRRILVELLVQLGNARGRHRRRLRGAARRRRGDASRFRSRWSTSNIGGEVRSRCRLGAPAVEELHDGANPAADIGGPAARQRACAGRQRGSW